MNSYYYHPQQQQQSQYQELAAGVAPVATSQYSAMPMPIPQQQQHQPVAPVPAPVPVPYSSYVSQQVLDAPSKEFFLTQVQHRVISEILPKGFSFQFAQKPLRQKIIQPQMPQGAYMPQQSQSKPAQAAPKRQSSVTSNNQYRSGANQQYYSQGNGIMYDNNNNNNNYNTSNYPNAAYSQNNNNHYQSNYYNPHQMMDHMEDQMSDASCNSNTSTSSNCNNSNYLDSQLYGARQRNNKKSKTGGGSNNKKKQSDQSGSSRKRNANASQHQMMPDVLKKQHSNPRYRPAQPTAAASAGYAPSAPRGNMMGGKGGIMPVGMNSEDSKNCFNILHALQKHKSAGPFLYPVDPIRQGCPDYYSVVRDPMDISTVERNLKSNQYQSRTQFAADVRKIWNNSYIFNDRESQIYIMTLEMDNYFEKKYTETEEMNNDVKNMPYFVKMIAQAINKQQQQQAVQQGFSGFAPNYYPQQQQQNQQKGGNMSRNNNNNNNNNYNYNNYENNQYHQNGSPISAQSPPASVSSAAPAANRRSKKAPSKMDTPMTMQEKKNLGASIMQLPHDDLRGIWEIVKADDSQEYDGNTLRFDLDTLSVRKTRELEAYVKQRAAAAAKRLSKKLAKSGEKHENKLNQQSAYTMDDETAATNQDLAQTQDFNYQDNMTQSTMATTQQQLYTTQTQSSQQVLQQQNYAKPQTCSNSAQVQQQQQQSQNYYPSHIDSESSFMSEDSESHRY